MYPGRLACAIEGGGKRRILAIGNSIKQRCLRPVHDWAMRVLYRIPTDGTYDEMRPIHRLKRFYCQTFYSFDFESAT